MRVATKLGLGFGAILLMPILVSLVSWRSLQAADDRLDNRLR